MSRVKSVYEVAKALLSVRLLISMIRRASTAEILVDRLSTPTSSLHWKAQKDLLELIFFIAILKKRRILDLHFIA